MPWVRIHDGAMSHPKLVGLIDWKNPFCLWVWGLTYCQMHLTDGLIPTAAMPHPIAVKTANRLVEVRAWEVHVHGFKVHDYLDWNDARDLVKKKRVEAKERMANARSNRSREHFENTSRSSTLGRVGITDPNKIVEEDLGERAARFLERFQQLYTELRRGARCVIKPSLDWSRACDLCGVWDNAHLEKLARVFLTTDEDWISRTDRGFGVFAAKATWCDDRLKAVEAGVS